MNFIQFLDKTIHSEEVPDSDIETFANFYIMDPDRPADTAGYKEICNYLKEAYSKEEGRDDAIKHFRIAWRDFSALTATMEVESDMKYADPVGRVTTEQKK
ncbi:MAG: hypothetical protein A2Y38_10260 [Spirochaetes bacterium GWB1_59_5]|nr:MAG: hypothetical protein A2Y38_10260 [Spirochaetes bacterium GWB1_59_5]